MGYQITTSHNAWLETQARELTNEKADNDAIFDLILCHYSYARTLQTHVLIILYHATISNN